MSQKHEINFGDLVYVKGYGSIPFYVDGWQEIKIYEPESVSDEKIYDITNAYTGAYEIAYAEDVSKICAAEHAEAYLRKRAERGGEKMFTFFGFNFDFNDEDIPNYIEKLRDSDKPKQAKIDELLDEYNDIKRIINEFGDDEENDYKAKINEIERKIIAIINE